MDITIPYNFEPRKYQQDLFRAMQQGQKRAVICWHRRSGKDKTCLNIMIWHLVTNESKNKKGTYYYFFPTFTQGRKALWDAIDHNGFKFLDHFPKNMIGRVIDNEMKIITKKGSVFQVIGTENYNAIMGTNPIGCVFSEYALQTPKAWDYIRPIMAENKGWAIFNFTPRGANHAYRILNQGKQSGWFIQILTVDDTQAISADALSEEKEQMPDDLFGQEYYCKFIDGASQFFKNIEEHITKATISPSDDRQFVLGIDLGKRRDFTVMAPVDLSSGCFGKIIRMGQLSWDEQIYQIIEYYKELGKPFIRIDSTGIGDPIYDLLREKGIRDRNIESYNFTEQSRKELFGNLQMLLDRGKIRIPNDPVIINEFKSVEYQLLENGKIKIGVPEGLHDDYVMAIGLACIGFTKAKQKFIKDQEWTRFQATHPFYDNIKAMWNM